MDENEKTPHDKTEQSLSDSAHQKQTANEPMSPQIWRRILETMNEGICISDARGVILYLNHRHAQLSGMTYEEMLGTPVTSLVPNKLNVVLNPQVLETGEPVTCVQTVSDGRRIVMEANPIFDDNGKPAYCATFSRDVAVMTSISQQMTLQKGMLSSPQASALKNATPSEPPRIFSSAFLNNLYRQISITAETDAPILLLGETGVGKDVFARSIHSLSPRKDKRFVKIDCGTIPENLVEAELFGYAPGAFSGANKNGKIGLIESADGGTLYLDEIGEMPLNMQVRLLRFLQDSEIVRVGSTTPKRVNIRIIAATNKDLKKAVHNGSFRRDLYYRLCVVELHIPPLRERRADILPLAYAFLQYYNALYHRDMTFTPEGEKRLRRHSWPGNVRELEHFIQGRVAAYRSNVITGEELESSEPEQTLRDISNISLEHKTYKDALKELESSLIVKALKKYGSLTEVAHQMHIDRSTLFRKIKEIEKLGIKMPPIK